MQTFLPFLDFAQSAKCLDNKRLGKQRLEAKQILEINLGLVANSPWRNHPAVLMWRGYEVSLARYGCSVCCQWIKRGYIDNQFSFFARIADDELDKLGTRESPYWLGNPEFHLSHQANLLRKDYNHYSKYFNVPNYENIPYYWPTQHSVEKDLPFVEDYRDEM